MRLFCLDEEGNEVEDTKRISPEVSSVVALALFQRRWFPVKPSKVSDSVSVKVRRCCFSVMILVLEGMVQLKMGLTRRLQPWGTDRLVAWP